jgi:hypothetical protein
MADDRAIAGQWLDREDREGREGRLERLEWLASRLPGSQYLTFPGGDTAKALYEEARYCFACGQFIAAIVLGLAYIEHTLAADFYAAGRNDLERASVSELLREAERSGWLTGDEYSVLEEVRCLRNPISHFRRPGHDDTIEARSSGKGELPYSVLERDAETVMEAVFHVLGRHAA